MQQILFIHGATTYADHTDYIHDLQTKPVYLERLTPKNFWFATLQDELNKRAGEEKYQLFVPTMPNKTDARYEEWAIWFGRIAELMDDDVILVGHSMGGVFLPKYLSEHDFPKKIKATILVAAPYEDETTEDLATFKITDSLEKFEQQGGEIIFFHGTNDPVVRFSELALFQKQLPNAEVHTLEAPDHFMREHFPELLDRIERLS